MPMIIFPRAPRFCRRHHFLRRRRQRPPFFPTRAVRKTPPRRHFLHADTAYAAMLLRVVDVTLFCRQRHTRPFPRHAARRRLPSGCCLIAPFPPFTVITDVGNNAGRARADAMFDGAPMPPLRCIFELPMRAPARSSA